MDSAPHPERRVPLKWLALVLAACVALVVFPPFHVRPLRGGAALAAAASAVDVRRLAEQFWTEKLVAAAVQPVDVRTLVAAIAQDPASAMEKYGRRAGIGGSAFFFVGGEADVRAVDHTGVWLTVDGANSLQLVLITGPIFGNALRDATGLLDIDAFNSFDFNALGAELNRLAETRVQPALRDGVSIGSKLLFLAAGDLDEATGDRPVLKLVPIRVAKAMSPASMGVLAAHAVCKTFPGVRALDDVSLCLHPGRLVALLGENGAGKSTLMSILAGVTTPDQGELRVDGHAVHFSSTRDARAHGIVAIFQELSLAGNLTVAENIFLGREPRNVLGLIDHDAMNGAARSLLGRLGLEVAPDTPLGTLRVGHQQVVEIARALSERARVLILDEPTSALAKHEVSSVLRIVAELKRAGVAILYITHKFEELSGIADDVAIMRDGRLIAQRPFAEVSHAEIVRLMVGREMSRFTVSARTATADEALRVSGASLPHATRRGDYLVRDVSLHVARGEVVGLFGLIGAGRTELLETIFGVHAARGQCRVLVSGRPVEVRSPEDAIAAGLALAPEDRKHDGLVLGMGSRENAGLACTRAHSRWGFLTPRREAAQVRPLLEQLRLKARSIDEPVRNLSGGNQQKVVLAKWLATRPKVLLLDEPTRGIDVNAKHEIYTLIRDLAAGGLAVLMASSELPEILAVCDRIIVLCKGQKTGELTHAEATPELLMQAALPRSASAQPA